ncbi:unnamed protein product [Lactuca saligna]|uniref:Uncharacterized protein n=1 Tax=Lactuca saligna TaxID=75948 RepID=A0AA36E5V6_LACSI|nr:unnamed protein product [Lactuca saligna]
MVGYVFIPRPPFLPTSPVNNYSISVRLFPLFSAGDILDERSSPFSIVGICFCLLMLPTITKTLMKECSKNTIGMGPNSQDKDKNTPHHVDVQDEDRFTYS